MQHYTDTVLYKTHQHFIVVIQKFLAAFLPSMLIVFVIFYFTEVGSLFITLVVQALLALVIFAWYYFFWIKSYFIISNEKIIVKVRNGIFSKFHMSIHYRNIRDTAFSKNNILHYIFGYGTFFARSSAGAMGDLEATSIPHIEKVYKIINALHNISDEDRKKITSVDDLHIFGNDIETVAQAAEKERRILLGIQGIKEVIQLTDTDRKYIFDNEEDRNHGVYECLRRQVLFTATHDDTLRDPDEAIVMKSGEKVVFPVVDFHEIQRLKVSSSSPGLKVHDYLEPKFQDFDEHDATLIIGFDM